MRFAAHRLLALVAVVAIIAAGCATQQRPVATPQTSSPSPTTSLISPKSGRAYSVTQLPPAGEAPEPFAAPTTPLGAASPDNFHGTDRGDAKTSLVDDAQPTIFADLDGLLASGLLVPDDQMLSHQPPITEDRDDPRTQEEQHAVEVTAFLYASSRESDNDFHCIIGTAPDHSPGFLNVEVSGLPLNGPFLQPLKDARDAFKAFFGNSLPGNRYNKFNPPIPVHIKGSLFYDIDHKPGTIGPNGLRPTTAWEIHPVSSIEFEPDSAANP